MLQARGRHTLEGEAPSSPFLSALAGQIFEIPGVVKSAKSRTYEGRRKASKMPAKPAGKPGTAGGTSAKSAQILEGQMKQLQATPP